VWDFRFIATLLMKLYSANMIEAGQYSDTLRALGSFIERTGATSVEIDDRGDHWLVAATLGSETLFSTFLLDELRAEARRHRGDGHIDGGLALALRTIGYQLDAAKAESFTLCQGDDGFRVTARCEGGETRRTYSLDDIEELTFEMIRRRMVS
jgi:hypothetical protein